MKTKIIILLFCFPYIVFGTTYYVSPTGSDANNGLSPASPFKTTNKVNSLILAPGDAVLFEGGATFNGHLIIGYSGSVGSPIVYDSYNGGKATIVSNSSQCISATDISNFTIKNLILKGDYVALANGCENNTSTNAVGITFKATNQNCQNIIYDGVEASGFKWTGLRFHGTANGIIQNSKMENCVAANNGYKGFETVGSGTFLNQNIVIRNSVAYSNKGWTAVPAGSGIHCSRVDGLIIEYCIAYDNGGNNYVNQNQCGENPPVTGGGGGGIWVSNCKDVLFQYNESYENKTGGTTDGHGFDIDGNVQDAIVQYNYAHDNHGAGYLIFQYTAASTKNVTVRYNISVNDGIKQSQGAIHLHRSSSAGQATENIFVYNNSIYNNINNVPMVHLNGGADGNMQDVHIINNLFMQPSGYIHQIHAINGASYSALNNHLHHPNPAIDDGNPMVQNMGFSGIIGDPVNMASLLTAYHPIGGSPLIDTGLDLIALGIPGLNSVGSFDFGGVMIPYNAIFDIGSNEYENTCPNIQLLSSNTFSDLNTSPIPDWTTHAGGSASVVGSINGNGEAHIDIGSAGSNDYDIQLWQDNIPIVSGELYHINILAKGAAGRTIRLILRPTSSPNFYLNHTLQLTSSFQNYSLSFRSPVTLSSARFSVLMGGDSNDVYIDEISLWEDCDGVLTPCVDYHSILLDPAVVSGTYKADIELKSNSVIPLTNSVILEAGECILLDANFEVQLGATLEALIKNCN